MIDAAMPALSDAQRIDLERKQLANALAKVNSGQVLTEREMAIVNAAHERSQQQEPPAASFFASEGEAREEITELGFPVSVTEQLEQRGIHDANRLLERDKTKFTVIARMIGMSVPVRTICAICSCSPCTVQRVKDHPAAQLDAVTQKQNRLARLSMAFDLGLDALMEKFKAGEVSAIEVGIIYDKMALESGGVTARTEVIITDDTDEYVRMVRAARSRMVTVGQEVSPMAPAPDPLRLPDSPDCQIIDLEPTPTEHTRDSVCPDLASNPL